MKAKFSTYLNDIAPGLKDLIAELGKSYDYVSVLSTDSVGFNVRVSQRVKSVSGSTLTTERGNVIRVYKNGLYSEYSFNRFDPERTKEMAAEVRSVLDAQMSVLAATKSEIYNTPKLDDEKQELFVEMETGSLPEETDLSALVDKLQKFSDEGVALSDEVIDCNCVAQSTHICKMFLTANKDLRQSYVYSEGAVFMIGARDGKSDQSFSGISDRLGPEIFDGMGEVVKESFRGLNDTLGADHVIPG